jgi:DNA (cytosine-5)-methyltransferase 1
VNKPKYIPVIDLFAGPGGLGEGFSSVINNCERVFKIKLSIEKDSSAYETLKLRSFYRQFSEGKVPDEYYEVIRSTDLNERDQRKEELYKKFNKEYSNTEKEVWKAELGSKEFPEEIIDERIKVAIGDKKDWVLIGGPPCQAYSLVGRSRVGGISDNDPRVYLYKEYLRIIAKHHPAIFVMENVKGLLSAKINDESIFDLILEDLKNPSKAIKNTNSPKYKIFSLSTEPDAIDKDGNPDYKSHKDYIINSEKHKIPQKRHRVILLGIREDIHGKPNVLEKYQPISLKSVIGKLPKIRSGIYRKLDNVSYEKSKKRRFYKNLIDSDELWEKEINTYRLDLLSYKDFNGIKQTQIKAPPNGTGSEYIYKKVTISTSHELHSWFTDPKLDGVPNHHSRSHLLEDLKRYLFASLFTSENNGFPRMSDYEKFDKKLLPDHKSATTGKFADRFRVQVKNEPATTVTSHISKDGHYFIHYDPEQCRSLTVREAARIQTFPDNYLFCGSRTAQYHQVGNAVPPYLAKQIADIVWILLSE